MRCTGVFYTLVIKEDFELWPDEATHARESSGDKWLTHEEGGCRETETLTQPYNVLASVFELQVLDLRTCFQELY